MAWNQVGIYRAKGRTLEWLVRWYGEMNPDTGKPRGISPHRLRDSFAVMAVRRDGSTDGVRMLQEQLGHANIGTTMRYRKVAGKELEEWYERIWGDG